ncbi:amidase [Mesorhizobium calcicola]|uniref:Indoleacetamide hydrolase n=1 Tax=Mesorhizobium calcicola TaxID=1300310 RepID=A0ABW4W762_9HYPH
MKLSEYVAHDAIGLATLLSAGEVTAVELAQLARQAHDRVNPRINAVIEFYDDAEIIARCAEGAFGGVPFLRKDYGATEAGRLQEMGSRLFAGSRSDLDSYFFRRARKGGLLSVGRTTTPEFAVAGMTESLLCGTTGNPWNTDCSAGGSSGGAAAAVAAGITPIAHGGDGGGSIRAPASWCGLVGLNPSRGRVSGGPNQQDPSFGLSREFVLCRTARDMAAALDVFAGPHPGDPFIIVQPNRRYTEELSQPTGKLSVGVARTKWGDVDLGPEVLEAVESIATLLEEMGHTVRDIEAPYKSDDYCKILLGIAASGATSLEAAARAMDRSINAETLEPINFKIHEYSVASRGRGVDVHEVLRSVRFCVGEAIQGLDILLTPTMPHVATPHGGVYSTIHSTLSVEEFMKADAARYQYTGIFNVTGQPSVSLPLAQSACGLPIGIQIVGRFGDEATLVRIARDLEEARPWKHRRPKIWAGNN